MAAELSRTRAEQLGEVESERATAMALLADEKADLEAKIARLRDIEAEQRSQMRHLLTEQLSLLDAHCATRPPSPVKPETSVGGHAG